MASKSKFFRVATEGATTDGRIIEKSWIQQMAKNFDPKKYGARVWLEHMRGMYPDSTFRAYGDVTAVEARPVEDNKLALFAQIEPLPDLVAMTNKAKQKIYTSIEVTPKFADTGEAYLTGLAVTDSPASLGTDILSFCASKPDSNPLSNRKSNPEALFSEAVAVTLEFEETTAPEDKAATKFGDQVKSLMSRLTGKSKTDDARFADVLQGFEDMGKLFTEQETRQTATDAALKKTSEDFTALQTQFNDLVKQLEMQDGGAPQRHAATGGNGHAKTDC